MSLHSRDVIHHAQDGSLMRIVLVRHGHPDVPPHALGPIAGTDLGRWYRVYNDLGLEPGSSPPDLLRGAAAGARCIVASDLPRAIESAQLLAGENVVQLDPDLREVGFPEGLNAKMRLSPGAWVMIARGVWLLDGCKCDETRKAAQQRAARLVDRLCELAHAHDSVVAVGHGWFNLFIGRELRRRQWRGPRLVPSGYWASAKYERSRSPN
jgi:broad specificity phosphatase PhoE